MHLHFSLAFIKQDILAVIVIILHCIKVMYYFKKKLDHYPSPLTTFFSCTFIYEQDDVKVKVVNKVRMVSTTDYDEEIAATLAEDSTMRRPPLPSRSSTICMCFSNPSMSLGSCTTNKHNSMNYDIIIKGTDDEMLAVIRKGVGPRTAVFYMV